MQYVYIVRSLSDPDRHYIGTTGDLKARLAKHNAGYVSHISKFGPWLIKTYLGFDDDSQAYALEKYLKTASGRALAKKRP